MSVTENLIQWVVAAVLLAPFMSFVINGAFFRKQNSAMVAGSLASVMCLMSFVASVYLFFLVVKNDSGPIVVSFWNWFQVDDLKVPVRFLVDFLSATMLLVVTGVGFLIHIFSIGYMSKDKRPFKYFSYLSFFIFNMLVLVLADNMLVMFVGWEGVGLASFLLIGFWFTDEAKAQAGVKAFIMNRIGDAGFLVGLFLLFSLVGSLAFSDLPVLAAQGGELSGGLLTLALLALFVGATGKSAQIPLYTWLPDAMAGPTPVSALIHAATMVTAGVYLFIRLSPVLVLSEAAMMVIAVVGGLTALMAAILACAQNDIKKILAYSTISQLGYMFLALGVGAFSAAFFHLVTHAFFKALMFLGAGAIIYSLHHEQDIRNMGGLRKSMPWVHITFVVGWLSIIGIPPFSGAFSKDAILWYTATSSQGSWGLWSIGIITALLTSFYMTRLMYFTFWKPGKAETAAQSSSFGMKLALGVLALLALFSGFLGLPHMIAHQLHIPNFVEEWFAHYLSWVPAVSYQGSSLMEWLLMGVAVLFTLRGVHMVYRYQMLSPNQDGEFLPDGLRKALDNRLYVDHFYQNFILAGFLRFCKRLWFYIEVNVIDKLSYVITAYTEKVFKAVTALQSGSVQSYLFYFAVGLFVMVSVIFWK